MRPADLVQETWSALSANKGRSALTILGIVIGIGAVITMNAIIGGISNQMAGMFGANAARILTINLSGLNNFTLEDAEDIPNNVAGVEYTIPSCQKTVNVTNEKKKIEGTIHGVTSKYFEAHGYRILQGSAFTEEDEKQGARVIVIDRYSVKNLFGSLDAQAVGKSLRMGNDEYLIVGVADKVNIYSVSEYTAEAVEGAVPITTALARMAGTQNITSIEAMTSETADADVVAEQTKSYLMKRYKLQDSTEQDATRTASVESNKSLMQQVSTMTSSFQSIMVTVSGISLLVGGIGIMNMMLTNVTERIREIGLRKALGAKRIDITSQFILESVCLCLTGGFVGVLLGMAGAFGLSGIVGAGLAASVTASSDPITPVIDVSSIINAVLVCVATGLIFGWYPAQRAAKLDPVESLNHQ